MTIDPERLRVLQEFGLVPRGRPEPTWNVIVDVDLLLTDADSFAAKEPPQITLRVDDLPEPPGEWALVAVVAQVVETFRALTGYEGRLIPRPRLERNFSDAEMGQGL